MHVYVHAYMHAQSLCYRIQRRFNVSAGAQLGGHKDGSMDDNIPGSFFPPTEYVGDAAYRHVQIKFDLQPPTHCLTYHGTADCLQYPIYLDEDIRTVSKR